MDSSLTITIGLSCKCAVHSFRKFVFVIFKRSVNFPREFSLVREYYMAAWINPNQAMEISEFIGRTITLFHRVDSRIPQRITLKMLPMRNAG